MNQTKISPGPWEYVPGTEHHGPYVTTVFGSTICDFYTMTEPREWSTASGGPSRPVNFCGEDAEANARLAAEAWNMAEALVQIRRILSYGENEGRAQAVKDSNANAAWHMADEAIRAAMGTT